MTPSCPSCEIDVAGEADTDQFVWRLGYLPQLDELMAKNSGGKPDQLRADKAKDFLFGYKMKK